MTSPLPEIGQLGTGTPLALLPVRVETRFRPGPVAGLPDAVGELLVRIYPDSISADSHEPLLSADEVALGQEYWRRAFADRDERAAWTALLGRTTAARAAWVVERTAPSNVEAMAGDPVFGPVPTRPPNWHRAPTARGLPDRFVVSGFRGGTRVAQAVGAPVRPGLALTPRLSDQGDAATADPIDLTGDGLRVPPELAWVYDLGEAVAAGMAVRVPLFPNDLAEGFDALLVCGVRTTTTEQEQAAELAGLLTAHRYSRGLELLAPGTRTNNTGDGPSDYPAADPAGVASFPVARGAPAAGPGTDGAGLAAALGLAAATVDHVGGAGRTGQPKAAAMIDALWPATVGYFLDQLCDPEVSQSTVDSVRAWMRQWVRPGGPLPALRVGPVPYGVLPVGVTGGWQDRPGDGAPPGLTVLLGRLVPLALALAAGPPHVGRSDDPDRDLVELLSQDASARTARVRRAIGYDTAWNMFGFLGTDMSRWETDQLAVGRAVLNAIGEPARDPRAAYLSYAAHAVSFAGPMVAPEPLSERDPLPFDYVAWLATAAPATLRDQGAAPGGPTALLYLMLRHALLTEYDRCSRRVLDVGGVLHATEAREAELVGILPPPAPGQPAPVTRTVWERFDLNVTGVTGALTVGQFLADPPGGPGTPADVRAALAELADLKAALTTLSGLPAAQLHRLFTETLDACSHRLDAWVTSLATRRLAAVRAAAPDGVWLGAYGWVENLRPDPPGDAVDVTLPDGSTASARRDDGGFVVAPSMTHAAAAAVLRSAYLSRAGSAYAVDLSSARVRAALAILDTVRDDAPLGSVLGATFERGLHERHPGVELDRFIDAFRGLYPAVANKADGSGEPAHAVAARAVVDGLALLTAFGAGTIPWGTGDLIVTTEQRTAIEAELAGLADAVDAVSDLLLGESVYQVVKGSTAGAAATLDTLAKGQRPPEPEVVATPRGGTVLYQRMAVLFGPLPPAWAAIPATPRSAAAPEVDAWLGGLLGDPARIECAVAVDGADPAPVTLAQLGLRPVDLLLLTQAGGGGGAELAARATAVVPQSSTVDFDVARPGSVPLAAAVELMVAAGAVLGLARPLTAVDLLPPSGASASSSDQAPPDDLAPELGDRAAAARQALTMARDALVTAGSDPGALAAALRGAAAFGVIGAYPGGPVDPAAADGVRAELAARLTAAAAAATPAEVLAAVFGRALPVVPRFRPTRTDVLGPALAAEPDLGDDPDSTLEGWVAQLARVRPAVAAWSDVRLYATAVAGADPVGRPRIAQLPSGGRWAGLTFGTEDRRPPSGLVSLALVGPPPPVGTPWSGLLLDSWPELLPSREEDAGVAFHFDAPGAQAPQAILVAVPPDATPAWSYDLLERTLLDTLALARVRALDLSDLGAYGQLLPMTFLTANQANDAVSTSFVGLLVADAVIASLDGG